jgi:hypothetical protein
MEPCLKERDRLEREKEYVYVFPYLSAELRGYSFSYISLD